MNYFTKNLLTKSAVGLAGVALLTTPLFAAELKPTATTGKSPSESTMRVEKKMENTTKKEEMAEKKDTKIDAKMDTKVEKMEKKIGESHRSTSTMGTTTKKMPVHKVKKTKKSRHTKDVQTSSSTIAH